MYSLYSDPHAKRVYWIVLCHGESVVPYNRAIKRDRSEESSLTSSYIELIADEYLKFVEGNLYSLECITVYTLSSKSDCQYNIMERIVGYCFNR